MAKIGIITYHFVSNYGAAMQAWALQKHLQVMGHEAYFIDYRPAHLTTGGAYFFPKDAWTRRANVVITYLKVMSLRKLVLGDGGKQASFEKFHQDYMTFSDRCYHTNRELSRDLPKADAYICGSDQIWNASEQYGIDSTYFLDFVPDGCKRISYAASFGRPEVHPRFYEETARLVDRIDAISVREQSGVDLVQGLCDREATWVPDPTLLVSDGYPEAVSPDEAEGGYIFSYTLRSRELVAEIEAHASALSGLGVVSPSTLNASGRGSPSPLEWLGYIKSAKYVITNSYHGTLFSIIFRKPFVFVGLSGVKSGFNERAKSLLNRLGLNERIMFDCDKAKLETVLNEPINWSGVEIELDTWRKTATDFLNTSIHN